jgi:hypothetical protein
MAMFGAKPTTNGNGNGNRREAPQPLPSMPRRPVGEMEIHEDGHRIFAKMGVMQQEIEQKDRVIEGKDQEIERKDKELRQSAADNNAKDLIIQQHRIDKEALAAALDDARTKLIRAEAVVEKIGADVLDNNSRLAVHLASVLHGIRAAVAPSPPPPVDQDALAAALEPETVEPPPPAAA